MKTKNEQKVIRKFVSIQDSEVTEKKVVSKYKKWQLKAAKWIGVEVADNHQYLFRIDYKGNVRLKPNDIVVNEQGLFFLVPRESNRLAMLISKDALPEKPKMYGKLYIIDSLNNKRDIKDESKG